MAPGRTYSCEKRVARKLREQAPISAGLTGKGVDELLFTVDRRL